MGLFTQEPKTDYSVPLFERLAVQNEKSQRQFTDMYLDPAIKENIGYESPRMKMKTLTQGVDLTDGKKVQETFLALQAIDPQEAQGWLESIKPVIQQQLNSLKIKDAKLKSDILANKGNVNAYWTGRARPQFINDETKKLFEIHGVAGPGVPTMALFRSRLKDLGLEKADRNRVYQDLAKALKAEEKDWKTKNQVRDFNAPTINTIPTASSNEFDDPNDNPESITSNVLGSQNTPGITQINKEASALDNFIANPKSQANADVRDRLSNTFNKVDKAGSTKFEFNMTKSERTVENKLDALRDWLGNGNVLTSEAHRYFSSKPEELDKFEKNPIMWFFANIKANDKTDYSEYNPFGN
jgi:hypothetical protein